MWGGPLSVQEGVEDGGWDVLELADEDEGSGDSIGVIPAVCGGILPSLSSPKPSRASRSRSLGSSDSASVLFRKECNSSDDSSTNRTERAFIVRGWRYTGLRNSARKATWSSESVTSGSTSGSCAG